MKPNRCYEIVLWYGTVSRTIIGTLIASLSASELRMYGKSAAQLQSLHHPLLPKGTPFDPESGVWYVIKPIEADQELEFVYDSWIKPNGITERVVKEITISGSFKSGRQLDVLHKAFIREGICDLSLALKAGQAQGAVEHLQHGVQYTMVLADNGGSKLWGIYRGELNYHMLSSLNISPEMEYSNYSWPESHTDKLDKYTWLIFGRMDKPETNFAIPRELVNGEIYEDSNQGIFEFAKRGTEDDVGPIRSVLNIAGATDIIIGTKS